MMIQELIFWYPCWDYPIWKDNWVWWCKINFLWLFIINVFFIIWKTLFECRVQPSFLYQHHFQKSKYFWDALFNLMNVSYLICYFFHINIYIIFNYFPIILFCFYLPLILNIQLSLNFFNNFSIKNFIK